MQTSNEEWILALLTVEFAVALVWACAQIHKAPTEEDFLVAHAPHVAQSAKSH